MGSYIGFMFLFLLFGLFFMGVVLYFFDVSILCILYEFTQEILVEAGYSNNPRAIVRVIKKYNEKISVYKAELEKDNEYNEFGLIRLKKLLSLEQIKLKRMEDRLKRANWS